MRMQKKTIHEKKKQKPSQKTTAKTCCNIFFPFFFVVPREKIQLVLFSLMKKKQEDAIVFFLLSKRKSFKLKGMQKPWRIFFSNFIFTALRRRRWRQAFSKKNNLSQKKMFLFWDLTNDLTKTKLRYTLSDTVLANTHTISLLPVFFLK